ncbi:hypothetical protein FJZ22_00510 [Candidatus Pacearchaeota archaeon]|nr:hypothetical protein [Candidatus Pacearchaeota archaeon]
MKEEVLGGIKNALERGISLDQAAKSFINAGYNPQDVQEAVQALGGVSGKLSPTPLLPPQQTSISKSAPLPPVSAPTSPTSPLVPATPEVKKGNTWRYVLIGLSIVIVLLIASLIGVIAFSEQILEWLKP